MVVFRYSLLPVFAGKRSSISTSLSCAACARKYVFERTQFLQKRHFFSKWKKTYEPETSLEVIPRSKTLVVVKPDSELFKPLRTLKQPSKYSPKTHFDNLLREAFPLKSIYRADMRQGMNELYEELNQQMDLQSFLTIFNMPDNVASWIRVCELHVFLMCTKFRPEEYLGKAAIDYLMRIHFNEIEYRSRRLAPHTALYNKEELQTLKLHTQYVFMGYDEGIQENDMVLAAALWRRFFGYKCDNVALIERLVKYIRVQLTNLQTMKFRDFIFYRLELFVPLSEVTLENNYAVVLKKRTQPEKRKLYSSTLPWINEKTYHE